VQPILILDKSAFQALSAREHDMLARHFMHNVTPVLMSELLGDLTKRFGGGRDARVQVQHLAAKVGAAHFNHNYRSACILTLLGAQVPMDGRILAENASRHGDSMFVDNSETSLKVIRWSHGVFEDTEQEFSEVWRAATRSISFDSLNKLLQRHLVIVPRPTQETDIVPVADSLLTTQRLQALWVDWILEQLGPAEEVAIAIRQRHDGRGFGSLRELSAFAYHCVRALLSLVVAVRHKFLRWDPTHWIDTQYLYYMPFCMIFASDDHVHRLLAPQLLLDAVQYRNTRQSFVSAQDLKRGLRELCDLSDGLAPDQRIRRDYALGSYPPAYGSGLVNRLWRQHCGDWPGSGNVAADLDPDQAALALEEARSIVAGETGSVVGA
jgi:hypothetical protein